MSSHSTRESEGNGHYRESSTGGGCLLNLSLMLAAPTALIVKGVRR